MPEDKLFASDAVQFRMADKALIERMNTDPEYRRDMLGRNPALLDWMKDPDLSKSPPNMELKSKVVYGGVEAGS